MQSTISTAAAKIEVGGWRSRLDFPPNYFEAPLDFWGRGINYVTTVSHVRKFLASQS